MGTQSSGPVGPDLSIGISEKELREEVPLLGHLGDDAIVLVKSGGEVFAVAASCTHYGGPLAEGLVSEGKIHFPLHHACFEIRSGRAQAPALNDIARWNVVRGDGMVCVGADLAAAP